MIAATSPNRDTLRGLRATALAVLHHLQRANREALAQALSRLYAAAGVVQVEALRRSDLPALRERAADLWLAAQIALRPGGAAAEPCVRAAMQRLCAGPGAPPVPVQPPPPPGPADRPPPLPTPPPVPPCRLWPTTTLQPLRVRPARTTRAAAGGAP